MNRMNVSTGWLAGWLGGLYAGPPVNESDRVSPIVQLTGRVGVLRKLAAAKKNPATHG